MELAHRPRAGAGRRPASSSSSTARRASPPTATSSSARRRRCRASSSAPASTPSASPRAAAPAWRWPNGWPRASRPTTSGRSTSAASARNHARHALGAHPHAGGLRPSTTPWPGRSRSTTRGRPLRRSPLYDRLQAQGAVLRREARLGAAELVRRAAGESARGRLQLRPAELVRGGRRASTGLPRARRRSSTRPPSPSSCWSAATPRRRCRWICANDVAKPPGSLVYTQMLNARAASNATSPSRAWPRTTSTSSPAPASPPTTSTGSARNIPAGLDARLDRRHLANAVLSLMGPRARDILAAAHARTTSRTPPSPSAQCRRICVAGAPVLALRVTYVGELGWELHVPVEFAADGLRRADGGRRGARPRQRRLPRHRIAAARKGLSRLGRRHRPRPLAARWPGSAGR